jgi:hypothetical protein
MPPVANETVVIAFLPKRADASEVPVDRARREPFPDAGAKWIFPMTMLG